MLFKRVISSFSIEDFLLIYTRVIVWWEIPQSWRQKQKVMVMFYMPWWQNHVIKHLRQYFDWSTAGQWWLGISKTIWWANQTIWFAAESVMISPDNVVRDNLAYPHTADFCCHPKKTEINFSHQHEHYNHATHYKTDMLIT